MGNGNCGSVTDIWDEVLLIEQLREQEEWLDNGHSKISDPRAKKFKHIFENCIKPNYPLAKIKQLSIQDKHKLYMLMSKITFYIQDRGMLDFTSMLLSNIPDDVNISKYALTLYERYVANWMLFEAKELTIIYGLEHTDYSFKLSGESDGNRQVIRPLIDNGQVLEKSNLLSTAHIIVVGSPFCQPSERFSVWLENRLELKSIMVKHSTWITSQKGDLRLNEVVGHNSQPNNLPYYYVYQKHQWPEIDYWATPTIYFYNKNKLVRQLVGWPDEGREEQLREALSAIGLLN